MKIAILLLILLVTMIGIAGTIFVFWRTYKVQTSDQQQIFLGGQVPDPLPKGDYQGIVTGNFTGDWQGKSFDPDTLTGINIFRTDGQETRQYTFTMSVAKGLQDKDINVIKIDYNRPENPWWLRYVLDEIVQTEPNKYLGKVHVRIIPGVPFTLGWFQLEKRQS